LASVVVATTLLTGATYAQPAFVSSAITIANETLFVVDTQDNSLITRTYLSTERSGYTSSAFDSRGENLFLAPTTRRRVEAVSLEAPFNFTSYPLSDFPRWIGLTPDDQKLYVSTASGLEVIDLTDGSSKSVFSVGIIRTVEGVVANPNCCEAYAAVSGNEAFPGGISIIDTTTDTVIDRIVFDLPFTAPQGITLSQDGAHLYVANFVTNGTLIVVDTAAREVVSEISFPLTGEPRVSTLSANGDRLYVSTTDGVAIVDTATNSVILESVVGLFPGALDLHPDGDRLYMLDLNGDLHELDAETLETLDVINTPAANLFQSNEFFAPIP